MQTQSSTNSNCYTVQLPRPTRCEGYFFQEARQDLRGIAEHTGRQGPSRALEFVRKLRLQAEDLEKHPLAFPLLYRFEEAGIRRRVFRGYINLHTVEVNHIVIVRILHGARNYAALLFPKS